MRVYRKKGLKIITDKSDEKFLQLPVFEGLSMLDCARAIKKLMKNVEELLDICDFLIKKGKRERSVIYVATAIEELSKIDFLHTEATLIEINFNSRRRKRKMFENNYVRHSRKLSHGLTTFKEFNLEQITNMFKISDEESKELLRARNNSLYVEFVKGKFIRPKQGFLKNKYIVKNLDLLINKAREKLKFYKSYLGESSKDIKSRLRGIRGIFSLPLVLDKKMPWSKKKPSIEFKQLMRAIEKRKQGR
ncbi:MAG: AbiV family abortive infection protein [Candidatus Levybacteria bacterium]|nr:AbiV family abortive infection protein [Candidatus Levybacteria bacterium]